MKSKFTSVVKAKKQLLDLCEVKLSRARAYEAKLKIDLQELVTQINTQEIPTSGNFTQVLHAKEIISYMNNQKNTLHVEILNATKKIDEAMSEYKEKRADFEKIRYLEDNEKKEMLKKLKRAEQLDIDEIASVLYVLGGKK